MKKTIITAFVSLLCLVAIAQDSTNLKGNHAMPGTESYCVLLRDGKGIVMTNNIMLNADITLKDGSVLQPSGVVMRKDGSKEILNEGQCIDREGKITSKNDKDGR